MAWGLKDDIWYKEADYVRFRADRVIAATMGEEHVYFGSRKAMASPKSVFPQDNEEGIELDDTLSRAMISGARMNQGDVEAAKVETEEGGGGEEED